MFATVLLTDIVGSSERAAELGDRAWNALIEQHYARWPALLARFRGQEVDTAGDGFFATFDWPGRVVRCAQVIVRSVGSLGIEVRAGVHTGEVETIDGKAGRDRGGDQGEDRRSRGSVRGPGVADRARPHGRLGIAFEDTGEYELKGVPNRWRLYRVTG